MESKHRMRADPTFLPSFLRGSLLLSLSPLRSSPPLMHQGEAGDSREGQKAHGLEIQFNTFKLPEISQISNKRSLKFIKIGLF